MDCAGGAREARRVLRNFSRFSKKLPKNWRQRHETSGDSAEASRNAQRGLPRQAWLQVREDRNNRPIQGFGLGPEATPEGRDEEADLPASPLCSSLVRHG